MEVVLLIGVLIPYINLLLLIVVNYSIFISRLLWCVSRMLSAAGNTYYPIELPISAANKWGLPELNFPISWILLNFLCSFHVTLHLYVERLCDMELSIKYTGAVQVLDVFGTFNYVYECNVNRKMKQSEQSFICIIYIFMHSVINIYIEFCLFIILGKS